MRVLATFALIVLGFAGDALAQSCASTQGQLELCKSLTNAVRFGFPRYTTAQLPACNANNTGAVAYDTTAGSFKNCDGSAWAAFAGGGGSTAFSSITSGTNTGAAMLVGTGASLGPTGTGTIAATSTDIFVANEGITGTTTNYLAKLTGAPSTAIVAGTSDTSGIVGLVVSGAGTTGSALIARSGSASCAFDGSTTAGDYVIVSTTAAGKCHDTGAATYPTGAVQVLGRVLSTNVGAGTYAMTLHMGTQGFQGSGTANTISKWTTGGLAQTDSSITDDGTSVVTTEPLAIGAATAFSWTGRGILTSTGAGVIQAGAAAAASPVSQTLQAQGSRGGTDTNVAGADLTITPGAGTGSATGSSIIFKTPLATGSGSTQQTQTEYFRLNSSAATYTKTGIGTTSADGLVLTNTTAAAAGAQQYSPRLRLHGSGWGTTAPGAQDVDWQCEVRTVQGTTAPTSNYVCASSVNGGAYTDRFTINSLGAITAGSDIVLGTGAAVYYMGTGGPSGLVHAGSHASNTTQIAGGAINNGGRVTFYGNTHSTKPNQAEFTASGGMSVTDLALTAGTMTAERTANLLTSTSSYTWTNAQVVTALATTGNITVATLPAKTQVLDAMVVITGAAATSTTLTVSCGRTGASYIDYIVASDAKAAANTVYGDASAERGTNLTGYDLPSYTGTTNVVCQFVKTGSDPTASTGRVILTTRLLP